MVVHGSGSFNSLWWYDWLYPKTACCLAGRVGGVPTVIASQGIGPLDNRLDRLVARVFFNSVACVGVRDGEASTSLARSLGARRATTWHTGDDSLLVKAESPLATDTALREARVPDEKLLIGVNFRDSSSYSPAHHEGGTGQLARLLDGLSDGSGAHVVFVPISYDTADDDRKSAAAVVNAMANQASASVLTAEHPAARLRAIVGRMHLCIGTSYHFLLFALSEGVPALGLYKNAYYRRSNAVCTPSTVWSGTASTCSPRRRERSRRWPPSSSPCGMTWRPRSGAGTTSCGQPKRTRGQSSPRHLGRPPSRLMTASSYRHRAVLHQSAYLADAIRASCSRATPRGNAHRQRRFPDDSLKSRAGWRRGPESPIHRSEEPRAVRGPQ